MKATKRGVLAGVLLSLVLPAAGLTIALWDGGPAPTSHPTVPAELGAPSSAGAMEKVLDQPGPVSVETVLGADWHVALSGLVNLDHPEAKAAHLADREEPIHVAFHALRHPTRGTFLVDTGAERALFEDPDGAAVRGPVAKVAKLSDFARRTDTKTWLDANGGRVDGVFLTHLHLDHVTGMRDVPNTATVFVGPGEATAKAPENVFVRRSTDRALEGKPPLQAWRFAPDSDGVFDGVIDVLGDATVFAIHVPGHTAGSTAFVVRSPSGPVLLTGDACHTAWGWDHGVEPGSFSVDKPRSAASLTKLRALAARHPSMDVRLGHQPHDRAVATASASPAR